MHTHQALGFNEMLTFAISDMARAVSERGGDTKQQQYTRTRGAVAMILDLHPRDVAEAMLAGHCVMFSAVIGDSARDTLCAEAGTLRRATRNDLVALNKAFFGNLDRLERYHQRPAQGLRHAVEAPGADAFAEAPDTVPRPTSHDRMPSHADPAPVPAFETDESDGGPAPGGLIDADIPRPAAATGALQRHADPAKGTPGTDPRFNGGVRPAVASNGPRTAADPTKVSLTGAPEAASDVAIRAARDKLPMYLREEVIGFRPSAETIAACRANPEAMAALYAGDPIRFARAMGVDMPCEDYLAAAAEPGSPFDLGPSSARPAEPSTTRRKT